MQPYGEIQGHRGLLDDLQAAASCLYLSDLHSAALLPDVQYAAYRLNAAEYSLREWNEAVQYITGQAADFRTVAGARQALLDYRPGGGFPSASG